MTSPRYPLIRTLVASVATGLLVVSGVCVNPAVADDAPPSGFPSWSDVQNAKGNAAAVKTESAKINSLLDGLEGEAGVLGRAAVTAGASYALTKSDLDAVSAQVNILSAQAKRAAVEGAKYQQDAVAAAVQSYKSGGTGLGIFASLSALNSQDSLQALDMLTLVGDQAVAKQTKAQEAQAVATALGKSLQRAQAERSKLSAAAKTTLGTAVAAQNAVTEQLNAKKEQSTTLVAQLASLNNTTTAVEQDYRQGQEALAAYNFAQAAKQKAAEEQAARNKAAADQAAAEEAARVKAEQEQAAPKPAPNVTAPSPITPAEPAPSDNSAPPEVVDPDIPGGAVNDPAGAQAYASASLGSYGWGSGEFQCLLQLWNRESNWLTTATNPSSGAYGIAQALGADRYSSSGSDWLTNYRTQVNWGLGYIQERYGSPCGAWAHSESVGWY